MQSKEHVSKSVLIGFTLFSIVLLGVLGSFAYFVVGSDSTNEEVSAETGNLALTFADGNNGITEALEFGGSVEKTFNIENKGTLTAIAKINFVDLINTYIDGSLTYSLSYCETENGEYLEIFSNDKVPRSENPTSKELVNGLEIQAKKTIFYKLVIKLNFLETVDQTADLNALFSCHFEIEEGILQGLIPRLVKSILNQKELPKDTSIHLNSEPDYNKVTTVNEGLYALDDNYGKSYYFRGDVDNNYVKFGKWKNEVYRGYRSSGSNFYFKNFNSLEECQNDDIFKYNCSISPTAGKDMYWRIIRVNGDGSVRLIYDGTSAHTNGESSLDRLVENGHQFNTSASDNQHVGYMYYSTSTNATTSKALAQRNNKNSNIKTRLEQWYEDNLQDYDFSISDNIFCNDRTTPGKDASGYAYDTALGYGNNQTRFGAAARAREHYVSPKFLCEKINDAFTKEDTEKGNGKLNQKVGLITADESLAAGITGNVYSIKNYLYKGYTYWTISPYGFTSYAVMYTFGRVDLTGQEGRLFTAMSSSKYVGIVPVVSLTSEYFKNLIGDGTMPNPYREKGMEP